MKPKILSAADLDTALRNSPAPLLLDVRLAEEHERRRIPGSVNNCVFEVAFLERLATQAPDKAAPICVYGSGEGSHEAAMACEKLVRAGYTDVSRLDGCLEAWCRAELPTEGTDAPAPTPVVLKGKRGIDLAESRVEWLGRNLLNRHWGRIALKSGHLVFTDGTLTGGEFVIDMNDVACDDLAGTPLHDVLIAHLRSDDFFDTELFPEAKLVIRSAAPTSDAQPGGQNLRIEADLTLKGVTVTVSFTASAGVDDQGRGAAQAAFALDRTLWNVIYGSGKFFQNLAGHLVNDWIEIQVRIVTLPG